METDLTRALNACRAFTEPRDGYGDNPFRLACSLDEPASPGEIAAAWPEAELPPDLLEAWSVSRQSRLFEDVDYGQWGLVLLPPRAAAERTAQEHARRPAEFRAGDVVIGEFLGDQDILVLSPPDTGTGQLLIALPLDGRADWPIAATSLAEFLRRFVAATGSKYWN